MRYDSNRIEVHLKRVHLLAQHLGSHVTRSATCVQSLLAVFGPCNAEVGEPEVAQLIKDQILRFDVSVENSPFVNVLNRGDDAGDQKLRLVLAKFVSISQATPQVGSRQKIHHQVEVIPVVEGADHVSDEGGVESLQDLPLVEDVVDTLLHHYQALAHLLHRVQFLLASELDLPDLAIATLADDLEEVKVVPDHLILLLRGVLGDLGHGGVQAGLLLGVVDFDDIGQGLLDVLLVSVGQLHLLALAFLGRRTLHLPEAGLGRVLEAGG